MSEIIEIPGKITSWEIVHEEELVHSALELAPLYKREQVESGKTIKTKFSTSESMYVTINFDESGIPRELFINKSSHTSDEWCKVTARLVSAIWRSKTSREEAMFVVDELIAIRGEEAFSNGSRLVQGSVQALGFAIRRLLEINASAELIEPDNVTEKESTSQIHSVEHRECPECHMLSYINDGGCEKCLECGYSKCG